MPHAPQSRNPTEMCVCVCVMCVRVSTHAECRDLLPELRKKHKIKQELRTLVQQRERSRAAAG